LTQWTGRFPALSHSITEHHLLWCPCNHSDCVTITMPADQYVLFRDASDLRRLLRENPDPRAEGENFERPFRKSARS
jgi:hypothetical protein